MDNQSREPDLKLLVQALYELRDSLNLVSLALVDHVSVTPSPMQKSVEFQASKQLELIRLSALGGTK